MTVRTSLARVCALRSLLEERVEAELRSERQRRQFWVSAAEQCRLDTRATARELFSALESHHSEYVVAAGVVRALAPVRDRRIAEGLIAAEARVEEATARWQQARTDRMQVETVLEEEHRRVRHEAEIKEQKSMDGWFLTRRSLAGEPSAAANDESSQRVPFSSGACNGTSLAKRSLR